LEDGARKITDRVPSRGIERFFRFSVRPNLIDALLPNISVLFTFRSALQKQIENESALQKQL
jgi:hypothetical protein